MQSSKNNGEEKRREAKRSEAKGREEKRRERERECPGAGGAVRTRGSHFSSVAL